MRSPSPLKRRRALAHLTGRLLRWVDGHLPALTVILALVFLPSYSTFELESTLYDLQMKARFLVTAPNERDDATIALVLIDDLAVRLDTSGLLASTPLSRRYLARLVDALARSAPSVIALDIPLDKPAAPADDSLLGGAMARALDAGIPVVLATRLSQSSGYVAAIGPNPALTRAWRHGVWPYL